MNATLFSASSYVRRAGHSALSADSSGSFIQLLHCPRAGTVLFITISYTLESLPTNGHLRMKQKFIERERFDLSLEEQE